MEQDEKRSGPGNETGQDQHERNKTQARPSKHFDIHPPVFWPATILLILFIAVTLIVGEPMERVFDNVQNWISTHFGWFLVLVVNFYLLLDL